MMNTDMVNIYNSHNLIENENHLTDTKGTKFFGNGLQPSSPLVPLKVLNLLQNLRRFLRKGKRWKIEMVKL
jgi:hypothetical protein